MCSKTGSKYSIKAAGFSDIGKCPTPPIRVNVEPAMASCAARSPVHEIETVECYGVEVALGDLAEIDLPTIVR